MQGIARRPWHVNFVAGLVVLWCAAVWLVGLYLAGVPF
jgi:hypothetical protein